MDELDLYRIADTLSLTSAAALICGERPSRVKAPRSGVEVNLRCWHILPDPTIDDDPVPSRYDAALNALARAVQRGSLQADKKTERGVCVRIIGNRIYELFDGLDLSQTMLDIDELKRWLSNRGVSSGFFFPDSTGVPDYLDPDHPRFAVKLAAAVKVWLAMEDGNLWRGKGAIKGMEAWLGANYKELKLCHGSGSQKIMNRTAIEEAAKVANWNMRGGAPKTLEE